MTHRSLPTVSSIAILLALVASAHATDAVLEWNEIVLDAVRADKTPPPRSSRALAIVHTAVFDAVNGILGGYEPYHVAGPAPAGALPEAAAAAAAHATLVALYPAQSATFDAAFAASLAAIPDGAGETAGVAWGEEVAQTIVALRATDGSTDSRAWEAPTGGGWWLPTPPALAPALLPNWPYVTPWTMSSGSQFRQAAPPSPNTAEHSAAFHEVRRLGFVDSVERTADQTQIALFWADGAGTATPPGHWFSIAQGVAEEHGTSLLDNARLFALLGLAVADAAIVSWDHKYAYNCWRPVTAIDRADTDGNPATQAEHGWTPLIATPPFPSYTSGHSTFSAASARILELFFGSDTIPFSTTSDGLPGVVREFSSFSGGAAEAGQSRIYGGIHFQYDNQAGLESGRRLAEQVFFNFLAPSSAAGACVPSATALCLNGGRFRVTADWATGNAAGAAQAVSLGEDSGSFWFFSSENTELLVKALDGCGLNERYWIFAAGTTDVEVRLLVTDTQTARSRRYFNPRGKAFAAVTDTAALATCP